MIIYDNKGVILIDVEVSDESVRNKVLNGENSLLLKFSLDTHVEVGMGSYCIFKNEVYYLMYPENITLKHRRNFEYELTMYTSDAKAKHYKFVNPEDGRLKFPLTAKPIDHLKMYVKNLNNREEAEIWSVGECPDTEPVSLSYNFVSCHDALVQLAEALELDYWFENNKVNIGKLEINKDNPLPLSYGGDGQGLKEDIKRANFSDVLPVEVLYVQGGEKNIDFSKYGAKQLHLPISKIIAYDGEKFEDEDGFDIEKARNYVTDSNGYSIRRADKEIENHSEDSLDCTEIYATKEEVISGVIEVDREQHFYDLLFASNVDYSKYQIAGETASIVFQTGMLAGKEFDLTTYDNGDIKCTREGDLWRIEIKPHEIDGIEMPDYDTNYIPRKDETFKVFGIQLPEEYIKGSGGDKTGAEWELFRYAVKHFYNNEDPQYTITGTLDELYVKRNWENIEGRLEIGNFISFSDKSFQAEPILIRIIGLKEYVNKPHSPVIEFSNKSTGKTLIGSLKRVQNEEVTTEKLHKESISYTKRRFRSAQETLEMLQAAFTNFSEGISPVTVRTIAMLVGDESLQFKFTASRESLVGLDDCPLYYDEAEKKIKGNAASLIHMTLGIDAVTAKDSRTASDYKGWDILSFESAVLDEAEKSYYAYVKTEQSGTGAEYMLSPSPIGMEDECNEERTGYYHFLVGILNSEYSGTRDFVTLYGFTEVLPGQITTDVIRSADGKTYFDLAQGEIGGRITFTNNNGKKESVADFVEAVQDQIDGVVENWNGEGTPTTANEPAINWSTDADKIAHINDTYINIEEYVDDDTTPTSGQAWRWCKCSDDTITDYVTVTDKDGNTFNLHWHPIADSDAVRALKEAATAAQRVEDMQYLRNAFAKGATEVSGGVVMSELIAVRDSEDSNIEAFLNGSDEFSDDTNGKLILAGGIPETTNNGNNDLKERAKEAKTRIYENGNLKTTSGEIGPFAVSKDGFEMPVGKLINVGTQDFPIWIQVTEKIVFNYNGLAVGDTSMTSDGFYGPIRMGADKDGDVIFYADCYNGDNGKVDFYNRAGMFAGLRPKTRVISSNTNVYLDQLDHTIVVTGSVTVNVYLYANPEIGQRYEFIKEYKAVLNIHPNGKNVYSSNAYGGNNGDGTSTTTLSGNTFTRATYVYTGTKWIRMIDSYD